MREALQEALHCQEAPFPTVTEISKQFRCSASVLYNHFSELCYELTKKHESIGPRVKTLGTATEDLSINKTEVSTERSQRPRKNSGKVDIDRIRKELENLLKNGADHPMTMTELADRFGCARRTLRKYFPDLCDKLMKRQEKEEYLSRLKQALEEALISEASPSPSVDSLARQLGCTRTLLSVHFPELCKSISQRYAGLTDFERQRNTMEEVIRSGSETNLSVNEIARRLGCANSALYSRFPEQCKSVVKRRWQAVDIDGMREVLEAVLANDEPPPTLQSLSAFLKCSAKNLEYYFPEICLAITERRNRMLSLSRFRPQLEEMLANDDPISMHEAARRLGCSAASLRNALPELCKSLSTRYLINRNNERLKVEKEVCNEVREIVSDIYSRGGYPSYVKVQTLVSRPGYFWRLGVRESWRNAIRELGLSD